MDWNLNLKRLMGEATQLVRSGQLADATRAIQQTLGEAVARHSPPPAPASTSAPPLHAPEPTAGNVPRWRSAHTAQEVEDAVVIDRSTHAPPAEAQPTTTPRPAASHHPLAEPAGSFTRVAFTHPGARHNPHHYHLYVPPGATAGTPMPLVLMLHGCTQNPVDFATGTGMNDAAVPANALVLYPEQPHSANPNGCWNWFRPGDQHRGSGEPALIVAMLRDVMARHPVDAQRVYVAGLSAGGAMAALLGREYPDLFAAVGVHSGLQAGAAHNVMGALSAMKNGAKPGAATHHAADAPALPPPPVIVFHGDADTTVHAHNGEQLIEATLSALATAPGDGQTTVETVHQGQSRGGQSYTRKAYTVAGGAPSASALTGTVVAEHWVLHGAGHAWAGGHAGGSHTDPCGVDATQEMLRFFLEHPRAARH
ncbi:poly(hydroxyalkanoate) depolymerase family esterase [Acidovorax sp. 100]|uniref:extracellular catalytic domain type 1 short-chain-length polyhydroxyalkanoate depolymerase n=1 Tax=Acidovorax sp. 100 TaxID=2135635 RepID=UPI000EFA25AB|nr:PHB depolymerase family esterase [Acidovorax sp. 100]RMA59761.1 poly(hydroxyalkanoate) depolymerase family esterase [Acidovorax sp. 100]